MNIDVSLFRAFNALAEIPWLAQLSVFFAQTAGPIFLVVLLVWFFVRLLKKEPLLRVGKSALYLAATAVLSRGILTELLRVILPRSRPFAALRDVQLLIAHDPTGSFPSGHAALYFALAFGLFFVNKKAGLAALIVATLIGVSRVIVGVHYPSDILGGAAVAFISAWVVKRLWAWWDSNPHGITPMGF